MKTASAKPVVLVPACNRMLGEHPFHVAGKKYLDAVRLAGGLPLIVPSAELGEIDQLLDLADGVLLTGSPSNVHPSHFGEAVADTTLPLDPLRDSWTLPLIRKVAQAGLPLFGICRGTQETNVALGGTLHQTVHAIDGHLDHRAREGFTAAQQYAPVHAVHVQPGGLLERILGPSDFEVNSLHGQAVSRLAPGLRLEALAPDGVVEAFSVEGASAFALCVQWHPEWQAAANAQSSALLKAFGEALLAYRARRLKPGLNPTPEPAHF